MSQSDSIYALSTPYARSGVAVVRISGGSSFGALEALGVASPPAPRAASLRKLLHPQNGGLIDEALVLCFPAPHSFTGEDVAELHIHGSLAVIKELLEALSTVPGLRPAEAGEFARRALLNGRMDLTEIEGLGDLIDSETVEQKRQAQKIMGGEMARHYDELRGRMVRSLALLEAYIDFPDEDIPPSVLSEVFSGIEDLKNTMSHILAGSQTAQRIRNGLNVVILGAPNVGKSSLLNAIAKRDIAITSATAGTTRDMIEAHLDIAGFPVILVDTAGIHEARDDIEREGIARALKRAQAADLKLLMFDATELPGLDKKTLAMIDDNSIILVSKSELGTNTASHELGKHRPIFISSKTGEGIDQLAKAIENFITQLCQNKSEPALITRERHRIHLQQALACLAEASPELPLEIICEYIRQASYHIGKITGRIMVDELLGEIFSSFCIGK